MVLIFLFSDCVCCVRSERIKERCKNEASFIFSCSRPAWIGSNRSGTDQCRAALAIDESNTNKSSEPGSLIQVTAGEAQGARRFALMRVLFNDPCPTTLKLSITKQSKAACSSLL